MKKVGEAKIQEIELSSEPSQYGTDNDWWNIIYINDEKVISEGHQRKEGNEKCWVEVRKLSRV